MWMWCKCNVNVVGLVVMWCKCNVMWMLCSWLGRMNNWLTLVAHLSAAKDQSSPVTPNGHLRWHTAAAHSLRVLCEATDWSSIFTATRNEQSSLASQQNWPRQNGSTVSKCSHDSLNKYGREHAYSRSCSKSYTAICLHLCVRSANNIVLGVGTTWAWMLLHITTRANCRWRMLRHSLPSQFSIHEPST